MQHGYINEQATIKVTIRLFAWFEGKPKR